MKEAYTDYCADEKSSAAQMICTHLERQNSIPGIHEGVRKQGCMQVLLTNQEAQS